MCLPLGRAIASEVRTGMISAVYFVEQVHCSLPLGELRLSPSVINNGPSARPSLARVFLHSCSSHRLPVYVPALGTASHWFWPLRDGLCTPMAAAGGEERPVFAERVLGYWWYRVSIGVLQSAIPSEPLIRFASDVSALGLVKAGHVCIGYPRLLCCWWELGSVACGRGLLT